MKLRTLGRMMLKYLHACLFLFTAFWATNASAQSFELPDVSDSNQFRIDEKQFDKQRGFSAKDYKHYQKNNRIESVVDPSEKSQYFSETEATPEVVGPDLQINGDTDRTTVVVSDRFDPDSKVLLPSFAPPLSIVVATGRDGRFFCSGMVIAKNAVATAAHCLPINAIRLGSTSYDSDSDTVEVTRVVQHPDADVAIAFLAEDLKFAPLKWRTANANYAPSGRVVLTGFGASTFAGDQGAGVRRSAWVSTSGWGCDGHRSVLVGCHPGRDLVIVGVNRTDTCRGDSGSPVIEPAGSGWRVLAITSRPIATSTSTCGDGGIYTRMDYIADWLFDMLKQDT